MVLFSILGIYISPSNVAFSKLAFLLASIFLFCLFIRIGFIFASLLHAEWLWAVACLTSAWVCRNSGCLQCSATRDDRATEILVLARLCLSENVSMEH